MKNKLLKITCIEIQHYENTYLTKINFQYKILCFGKTILSWSIERLCWVEGL